jgi:hypothetical protein
MPPKTPKPDGRKEAVTMNMLTLSEPLPTGQARMKVKSLQLALLFLLAQATTTCLLFGLLLLPAHAENFTLSDGRLFT